MYASISAILAAGADPRIVSGNTTATSLAAQYQLYNVISLVNITLAQWNVITAANTSSSINTLAAASNNNITIDTLGANSIFLY
jgi:hypothetical protein